MEHAEPLVDRDCLFEKIEDKSGWTYVLIPEIAPDLHAPFGWVRVCGSIGGVAFSDYRLMPANAGSGRLLMAVKAAICKKIGK